MNTKSVLLFIAVISLAGCGVDEDPSYAGPYTGTMGGDLYFAYEDQDGAITETEFEGHFEYSDIVANLAQTAEGEVTMVIRIKFHEVFYIDVFDEKLHFENEPTVKLVGRVNGNKIIFPTQEPAGANAQLSGNGVLSPGHLTLDVTILDGGFGFKTYSYYSINMEKI